MDGLVRCRRKSSGDWLYVLNRPALLPGRAAGYLRRHLAHFLFFYGPHLRRSSLDDADDMVVDSPRHRHRYGRAESGHAVLAVPAAGAVVRFRRWKLR